MYDVIIIGAGTAGLIAARQLSCNYLVLESKKEIGYPLRCGEGIREDTFVEFFGYKHFPFIKNAVNEHVIIVNNLKRSVKENYLQVDKPKFEQWLAESIKENIKIVHHVDSLQKNEEFVEVSTDKGSFKAKLVIIGTGAVFKLQKQLGLCKKERQLCLGYGGLYKNHKWNHNKFYFAFDDEYSGGFWVFPKDKETANIGFGSLDVNVKDSFNKLLKKYVPNAVCIKNYGGMIDLSGPIKKTYTDRILVIGGAAGLVNAVSGEGIAFAMKSGRMAGIIADKAVHNNDFSEEFLEQYEHEWKKDFGEELYNSLDIHMLMRLGFRYNVTERLFSEPTEDEVIKMFTRSELPKRARLALKLIKLFGLNTKNLTKKPISKRLRYAYRIGKLLSH